MEIMKNKDVLFYEVALDDVELKGIDVVTLLSRNKELATEEAKHLRAPIQPTEKIKEYRSKLNDIQMRFSKKNSEGHMIMRVVNAGGERVEIPDIEDFDNPEGLYAKEYAKLRQEFAEELKEYEELIADFKKRLDDDNENFTPILIDFQYLPKDIGSKEMRIIWELLDKSTIPAHLK